MYRNLPNSWQKVLKLLVPYLVSILLFMLTIEVCARIDDKIKYNASLWGPYDWGIMRKLDSDDIPYNIPNCRFEKWKINEFGFRGEPIPPEKRPGIVRIACMGASETFGLFEDPGLEWPAQLNSILSLNQKYQVINAGIVGINLNTMIPYLKKYVLKGPPIVISLFSQIPSSL